MKNIICTLLLALAPAAAVAQTNADSTLVDTLTDQSLGEVTVVSQRQLVKNDIDKLTYDVAGDKDARTSSVLEILKKVPMVSVDGQDNILVNGSSSYKIYKNGHPDPSFSGRSAKEIFRGLPASTIKKVEVITEPGAKYDAEGTTTILNIIMKDNASLVGVAGWAGLNTSSQGYASADLGITVQKGKWTVSNDVELGYQPDRMNHAYSDADYNFTAVGQHRHEHGDYHNRVGLIYDALSASYEIDSLNLLSLSGSLLYYKLGKYRATTDMLTTDDYGNLLNRYTTETRLPKYSDLEASGRADYQHKTRRDGEVLTLSYMISSTRLHRNSSMQLSYPDEAHRPQLGYDGYLTTQREHFLENTFQIDYIRPLWEGHKIEAGAKYINRSNKSKSLQGYNGSGELPDSTFSDFDHLTQVAAAYLQYIYSSKHWSASAGLRYEYSYLRAKFRDGSQPDFHSSLNDWCPSASVMFKLDDANSLRLGYSTSINRPGISYLNPMVFETPTGGSYGNPDLGSARIHNFGLSYSHTGPKLNARIMPYFNMSNSQIDALITTEGDKIWTTYGNVIRNRRAGVNYYIQWKVTAKTDLYFTGNTWHQYLKNASLGYKLEGWGGTYYTQLTQSLPAEIRLSATVGGSYGNWPADVYSTSNKYFYYGLSLQKSMLNDRLNIQLDWSNPFIHHNVSRTKTVQGGYTGSNSYYSKAQSATLTISWSFGKLHTQVKRTDTTIENNDMIGGIKK